jgi:predicted RNA binding protein YcfA (HicA-like mRNA interferase family)
MGGPSLWTWERRASRKRTMAWFDYWASNPGRPDQYDPLETADITWREFNPLRPVRQWSDRPLSGDEALQMKKLFAISHRECFDLMRAWGFEPERISGGHQIMQDPDTGARVQIMPPDRPGTGEKGNAIGMKKAARLRGVSIQTFLAGPNQERDTPAMSPKEDEMGRPMSESGTSADIRKFFIDNPTSSWSYKEVAEAIGADVKSVQSLLGQMSRIQKPNQPIVSRGGGRYEYCATEEKRQLLADHQAKVDAEYAKMQKQIAERVKAETPPQSFEEWKDRQPEPDLAEQIEKGETEVKGPLVQWQPMKADNGPKAVPANGSTPDLLSKVAQLDGNKYLFQGDDGALYVLKDVVRLEV